MNKSRKIGLVVAIIVVACLVAFVVETQARILRRAYDNLIMDNRNHYLPCEKLPAESEVERIVQEHQDTLQAIEQVNPGLVGVDVDSSTCPGKADLVIWYASHQNRVDIESIIGGDTFFGVPYRLQNR